MLRRIRSLALALLGAATCVFGLPARADDPRPDESPQGPFRRAPFTPGAARNAVEFWEKRVKDTPDRFLEQRELAAAYLTLQRETGDIQDAVRAEAAARRSLELLGRGNVPARTRLCRSLLAQHRFPEALTIAREAASIDPKVTLLVADIQLELGDYDAARRSLAAGDPEPENLNEKVLRAKLASIEGDTERALRLVREAAAAADNLTDLPAETAAWFHVTLGHTLIDLGRLDDGDSALHAALSIYPRDYRAMTGLAESAAFRDDWKGVISWAGRALELAPQNPEAIILCIEAHTAQGQKEAAEQQRQALKNLAHSFPRIYDRHWARFCADHDTDLDEALDLARKDLELRKDIQAHDTLAWVAFKKGLPSDANSAIRAALGRWTADASLYYHATLIARAAKDPATAASYLARARSLNPHLAKSFGLDAQ
jgi:tetratricopeptide (TPR) repeat protein